MASPRKRLLIVGAGEAGHDVFAWLLTHQRS